MRVGRVEWFSEARGFGEIADEATGERYYVIFDAIEEESDPLEQGERVSFTPGSRGEAQIATCVRRLPPTR